MGIKNDLYRIANTLESYKMFDEADYVDGLIKQALDTRTPYGVNVGLFSKEHFQSESEDRYNHMNAVAMGIAQQLEGLHLPKEAREFAGHRAAIMSVGKSQPEAALNLIMKLNDMLHNTIQENGTAVIEDNNVKQMFADLVSAVAWTVFYNSKGEKEGIADTIMDYSPLFKGNWEADKEGIKKFWQTQSVLKERGDVFEEKKPYVVSTFDDKDEELDYWEDILRGIKDIDPKVRERTSKWIIQRPKDNPFLYSLAEIQNAFNLEKQRQMQMGGMEHTKEKVLRRQEGEEMASGAPSGGGRLKRELVEVAPGQMGTLEGAMSLTKMIDKVKQAAQDVYSSTVKLPAGWLPPTSDAEIIQMLMAAAQVREYMKEEQPEVYDAGNSLFELINDYNKKKGVAGADEMQQARNLMQAVKNWRDNKAKKEKRQEPKIEKQREQSKEEAYYDIDNWTSDRGEIEEMAGYVPSGDVFYNKVTEDMVSADEFKGLLPKIRERVQERMTQQEKRPADKKIKSWYEGKMRKIAEHVSYH